MMMVDVLLPNKRRKRSRWILLYVLNALRVTLYFIVQNDLQVNVDGSSFLLDDDNDDVVLVFWVVLWFLSFFLFLPFLLFLR